MKDLYIFILGLFGVTEMVVAGFRMPVAVLFLIPMLFKAFSSFQYNQYTRKFILYICLWILGMFISYIYNDGNFQEFMKQAGKTACLFLYLPVAMWTLKDKPHRILYFMIGLGISGILQFFIFPVADFQVEVEESGYEHALEIVAAWFINPIIIALCSILYYKGFRYTTILIAIVYGFWAILNNSRSSLLIFLTFSLLMLWLGKPNENKIDFIKAKIKKQYKKILLVLLLGLVASTYAYQYMAENNILDERSTQKYYAQKYGNDLGLATGRVDFFTAAYAIMHKPIIGYGTPPKDKEHLTREFGRLIHSTDVDWPLIPTHSHILGSWVKAGIFGIFFWVFLLKIMYIYTKDIFLSNYKMWAFSILNLFSYGWTIFFSPYAGARGYKIAFIFSYFIIMITQKDKFLNVEKSPL